MNKVGKKMKDDKVLLFLDECINAESNNGVVPKMSSLKMIKDNCQLLEPISVSSFNITDNILYFKTLTSKYLLEKYFKNENNKLLDENIVKLFKEYMIYHATKLNPYNNDYLSLSNGQLIQTIIFKAEAIFDVNEFCLNKHKELHNNEGVDETEVNNHYILADYLLDLVERSLLVNNVFDTMDEFIGDDVTNIYFVKVINNETIFLEKCMDFRIIDWENKRLNKEADEEDA